MPTLLQGGITNPNRAVAVLTPLLFAPAAGAISALAAKYGLDIGDGSLQAIFITGSTIAFAKSAQWMKGWQDYEKRQDAHATGALALAGDADVADVAEDELDDIEPVAAVADDLPVEDLLDEDDMDDDFDAEAAELLAGHGS